MPMMLITPILATQRECDGDGADDAGEGGRRGRVDRRGGLVSGPPIVAAYRAEPQPRVVLLSIIVLCLGIAWLTSLGGLSLALGAFIAGLVASESEYSHQALAEVLPFRDSFNSLFFVSIGVLMDLRVVLDHPFIVLGLLVAVIVGSCSPAPARWSLAGAPPRSAVLGGVALAQVGEFSFILAQQGQDAGLFTGDRISCFWQCRS